MGDKIGGASQIGYLQSGANGPGGVGETSAAKTNGPADEVGNPNIRMIEPRKTGHPKGIGRNIKKFMKSRKTIAGSALKKLSAKRKSFQENSGLKKDFFKIMKEISQAYPEKDIMKILKSEDFEELNRVDGLKAMNFSDTLDATFRTYPNFEQLQGICDSVIEKLRIQKQQKSVFDD